MKTYEFHSHLIPESIIGAMRAGARARTGSSPKELLRRLYFDTNTHDPQALRCLIDLAGAGHDAMGLLGE